ncbi:hypothetical protein T01_7696 [Trichinella spiralis]|uniref:Uncharacterized protein n=1 Tax=Trichinella spiralis TaxID=6334 RepID=A0A0V1BF11_TRISP|nr:hypothetical protein T01_7696 [Trichinella spiralis]
MVGKSSNFDYATWNAYIKTQNNVEKKANNIIFVPQQRRRHFLNRRHSAAEVATFELLSEGKASKIR